MSSLEPVEGSAEAEDPQVWWGAFKPITEAMRASWQGQHAKLTASPERFCYQGIPTTGPDGKRYEMGCIPLRRYPMWLATIDAAKIRHVPATNVALGSIAPVDPISVHLLD